MGVRDVFVSVVALAVLLVIATAGSAQTSTTLPADSALALAPVVQPRSLAGAAAAVIVGLLLLLYFYRRRLYILYWIGGWGCFAAAMFVVVPRYAGARAGLVAYGAAQFLSLASACCFYGAALSHQAPPRLRRREVVLFAAFAAWFMGAPLLLGSQAVFVPGHFLTAIALAIAGIGHMVIMRDHRLFGAGVIGVMLMVTAFINAWVAAAWDRTAVLSLPGIPFAELALYFVAALGMQLMTFEDLTHELRRANHRLEAAQIELRQMVVTDALTGCRNRRFFDEVITHELNGRRRYGTALSLLFVDIDHFKSINDTQGHAVGDRVLREVAAFLMRKTRDADYVFRWGGDEFLLLLACREDEAMRRGLELQQEFLRLPGVSGLPSGVGLSFGCAEISPVAETVQDALKTADERMYLYKRRQRIADIKAV